MLCASASLEAIDPVEDGRGLFLPLRKLLSTLLSRLLGEFGAVKGEKPLGGFAVLMMGGDAASSSRSSSSSRRFAMDDCESPPYWTPKEPFRWLGTAEEMVERFGMSSGRSKWALAGLDMTERLVIKEEMTSGEPGGAVSVIALARKAESFMPVCSARTKRDVSKRSEQTEGCLGWFVSCE